MCSVPSAVSTPRACSFHHWLSRRRQTRPPCLVFAGICRPQKPTPTHLVPCRRRRSHMTCSSPATMVFFMQTGFALLEVGSGESRSRAAPSPCSTRRPTNHDRRCSLFFSALPLTSALPPSLAQSRFATPKTRSSRICSTCAAARSRFSFSALPFCMAGRANPRTARATLRSARRFCTENNIGRHNALNDQVTSTPSGSTPSPLRPRAPPLSLVRSRSASSSRHTPCTPWSSQAP